MAKNKPELKPDLNNFKKNSALPVLPEAVGKGAIGSGKGASASQAQARGSFFGGRFTKLTLVLFVLVVGGFGTYKILSSSAQYANTDGFVNITVLDRSRGDAPVKGATVYIANPNPASTPNGSGNVQPPCDGYKNPDFNFAAGKQTDANGVTNFTCHFSQPVAAWYAKLLIVSLPGYNIDPSSPVKPGQLVRWSTALSPGSTFINKVYLDSDVDRDGKLTTADACQVTAGSLPSGCPAAMFYRLRELKTGYHFYTTSASERNAAVSKYGYVNEGNAGYISTTNIGGLTPLYRLRRMSSGDHLYTTSAAERDSAIANYGFASEGTAGYVSAPVTGTTALYRLRKLNNGEHFYTTSATERQSAILNYGYVSETTPGFVYTKP
jgi:hypothetical protein